jgi:hypothetical protein
VPDGVTPVWIRAVPWDEERARCATELARVTGGTVIWDRERSGYGTFLAALRAAGPGPSIHLEDDITLTAGWRDKIETAIAARPGRVLQFFSMRAADLTTGSRDEPGRTFMMTQCFYLPAGYAAAIAESGPSWEGLSRHPGGWDMMLADWLRHRKLTYRIEVPSLVEHRAWKSVMPTRRSAGRQSRTFQP